MIRICKVYFARRILVLIAAEALLVSLAFLIALFVHFGSDAKLQLMYEGGVFKILFVAIVCISCMHYGDLYSTLVISDGTYLLSAILRVAGISSLALALLYSVYPPLRLNSGPFCLGLTLTSIGLLSLRFAFSALNRSGKLTEKAVLVEDGVLAEALCAEINSRPELGLRVAGYVSPNGNGAGNRINRLNLQILGSTEALPAFVEKNGITRVIVAREKRGAEIIPESFRKVVNRPVLIQDAGELYEAITGKIPLASLEGTTTLLAAASGIPRSLLIYKRAASIVFSLVGLVFALPVIAIAAVAVRIDSPGPAFFRQTRVGKNGKLFTLYKLRTMYYVADAERRSKPAHAADSRFTRVGKWLRQTRIDEFPQLFNILRGDMCLIGPRPFAADMEMDLAASIPFYEQRWLVKPGATGWAQIRRGYCATLEDNIEKLSYDIFYIKNMSVGLDFMIALETIKTLLLRRGSV
jgi:exopolysaccharide biosynthesis polyprenyl glycosylphosphotransferase